MAKKKLIYILLEREMYFDPVVPKTFKRYILTTRLTHDFKFVNFCLYVTYTLRDMVSHP